MMSSEIFKISVLNSISQNQRNLKTRKGIKKSKVNQTQQFIMNNTVTTQRMMTRKSLIINQPMYNNKFLRITKNLS